jgi:hypothetical protein
LRQAQRLARGREDELGAAVDRTAALLERLGPDEARELRGIVDAIVRGLPTSSVAARAAACEEALRGLGAIGPGDQRASSSSRRSTK